MNTPQRDFPVNLVGYHVATHAEPLPKHTAVGGDYLVAANGIFKRAMRPGLAVTIQIDDRAVPIPDLCPVQPGITWSAWPRPLPGNLLRQLLTNALNARSGPNTIEYHAVFALQDGQVQLIETTQQATAVSVVYDLPANTLLRVHSHHAMPAYFSHGDDADDTDLSISAVIGAITTQPMLRVRANCYGHRQELPPSAIFDTLGPFKEHQGTA